MNLICDLGIVNADMTDCIDLCSVSATVIRYTKSPIIKGRTQPPNKNIFKITASIQPMTSKDLKTLPEGMKNEGTIKIYTNVKLNTVETSDCKIPDEIFYNNIRYQISKSDDWYDLGKYYKYIASRIDR